MGWRHQWLGVAVVRKVRGGEDHQATEGGEDALDAGCQVFGPEFQMASEGLWPIGIEVNECIDSSIEGVDGLVFVKVRVNF
jgi:hypothetical protein